MGRAHGACESQARREEETMLVASLTTSNEAWGRNPHVPKGFVAAPGRRRRCRSFVMTHIAVVAAPRGRPRGATNATDAMTRTHPQRMTRIRELQAREILDSRGNPTIEVE